MKYKIKYDPINNYEEFMRLKGEIAKYWKVSEINLIDHIEKKVLDAEQHLVTQTRKMEDAISEHQSLVEYKEIIKSAS